MSQNVESLRECSSPTLVPQTPSAAGSETDQMLDDIDPLEAHNLQLQRLWDSYMEDKGGNAPPNRKTIALLLSWDPSIDELDVGDEVTSLENVLKNTYNYTVIREYIKPGKHAQHQVGKYLADFVHDHDADNTLLMVYYAGHGSPGVGERGTPGHLILEGERIASKTVDKKSSKMRSMEKSRILWHEAEHAIKDTDADVFVIFDCCYAGNLVLESEGRGNSFPRNFEFMGATNHKSRASIPGKESFTSALIWALRELAQKQAPFTVTELLNKIQHEAPYFPARKQAPFVSSRFLKPASIRPHLQLAIQLKDSECDKTVCPAKEQQPAPIKETVDLRICFTKSAVEEDIESLANAFKDWIGSGATVQRVQWLKLRTPERLAQRYALQWQRQTLGSKFVKSSRRPDLRLSTEHSPYNNSLLTPLLTSFGDQAIDLRGVGSGLQLLGTPGSAISMSPFSESPELGKSFEERKLFSVSQKGYHGVTNKGKDAKRGLFYHIFGILKLARDLLRQPEFRWISMVVFFSIAFGLLRLSLPRNLEFTIVPVRIFNITRP